MNYYSHHIGDFDRATRHLTRIERSVYLDLMFTYYDTEQPLTIDMVVLCRKIVARSEEEKAAVLAVLDEFFVSTPAGWFHDRCEEELAKFRATTSQASAAGKASAAARAERRKAAINGNPSNVERRANENPTTVERPLNDRSTGVVQTANNAPTNQEPRTKNQEPEEQTHRADALAGDAGPVPVEPKFNAKATLIAAGVDKQKVTDYLLIRKTKKLPLTLTAYEGLQREAEAAGIDVPAAVLACCENGWAGFKSAWYRNLATSAQSRGAPSALNDQKFRPNSSDYSSSDAAMARTIERHGIVIDPNEDIKF